MVREEADLPCRLVGESILVEAGLQKHIGRAEIDADAAADLLGVMGFWPAVTLDAEDLEAHFLLAPLGIREGEREVAVDAAADLVTLGIDADRLRHRQRAVPGHRDIGMVAVKVLLRPRRAPDQKAEPQRQESGNPRHGDLQDQNFTVGTARSAGFSISK